MQATRGYFAGHEGQQLAHLSLSALSIDSDLLTEPRMDALKAEIARRKEQTAEARQRVAGKNKYVRRGELQKGGKGAAATGGEEGATAPHPVSVPRSPDPAHSRKVTSEAGTPSSSPTRSPNGHSAQRPRDEVIRLLRRYGQVVTCVALRESLVDRIALHHVFHLRLSLWL